MSEYTQDWFSSAAPLLEIHLKDFKGKENLRFLEIGSYEGRSTVWFLENILTHETSKIVCVDTFAGSEEFLLEGKSMNGVENRFRTNLEPFKGKYRAIKGYSQDILRGLTLKDNFFDLIYIDGSHTSSDTLADAVLAYYKLKSGGLMVFDDYMWNFNRYSSQKTPFLAINSFMECFRDRISAKEVQWKTVILKKR